MQRVCPKCNTLVTGDGSFCPSCGEPLPSAVELKKEPAASVQFTAPQNGADGSYQYTQGNSNQSTGTGGPQPNTVPNYGTPVNSQFTNANIVNNTEMTLGQWVGTVILTTWFGLVSLILCIVWGVSDSTPMAKKRYCQAMIIIQCIGIAVSIVSMIVMFTVFASLIPEIAKAIEESSSSGSMHFYY
ncbi:MAG: hypothetical protein ACI4WS_02030 [Oscillospiraceae bacterium]